MSHEQNRKLPNRIFPGQNERYLELRRVLAGDHSLRFLLRYRCDWTELPLGPNLPVNTVSRQSVPRANKRTSGWTKANIDELNSFWVFVPQPWLLLTGPNRTGSEWWKMFFSGWINLNRSEKRTPADKSYIIFFPGSYRTEGSDIVGSVQTRS